MDARLTAQVDQIHAAHREGDTKTVARTLEAMWAEGYEAEADTILDALLADNARVLQATAKAALAEALVAEVLDKLSPADIRRLLETGQVTLGDTVIYLFTD